MCGFKSRLSHAVQISNDGGLKCESSSGVELHLAKVDVAGPNPVFRLKPVGSSGTDRFFVIYAALPEAVYIPFTSALLPIQIVLTAPLDRLFCQSLLLKTVPGIKKSQTCNVVTEAGESASSPDCRYTHRATLLPSSGGCCTTETAQAGYSIIPFLRLSA